MTTPEATPATLESAVEAARAEIVARGEPDPFTNQPVAPPASGQEAGTEVLSEDNQAPEGVEEQDPVEVLDSQDDEAGEHSDELFADLEPAPEEEAPEETPAAETEATGAYEVPGFDEPVPIQELINGYLRQSDYTRKTQEVARDRERLAKAEEFYAALTNHPKELAAQLAAAAGFIEPGAQPLQVVDLPFRSDEEVEAEIDRRVREVLGDVGDPSEVKAMIEEARDILALQEVESTFAEIEADIGRPVGPQSRKIVLEEAVRRGTNDLRLVFDALMQRQQEKARSTEQHKRSAPVRPTGKASQSTVTAAPETALDAVALAAEQAGVNLDLSQLNFR